VLICTTCAIADRAHVHRDLLDHAVDHLRHGVAAVRAGERGERLDRDAGLVLVLALVVLRALRDEALERLAVLFGRLVDRLAVAAEERALQLGFEVSIRPSARPCP
jgi:hypothetical protein